jgi:LacI family transcriptional regulator
MVTLKDVALKCGVSVASASKALNNMSDISPATALRIRDTAKELGYYPNIAARTLKTSHSRTIGILVFLQNGIVWMHEYFSKIIGNIQVQAERSGYDITIINCEGVNIMGSYLAYCKYRNYDGVIIVSAHFSEPTLIELINSDLPLATVDYVFNHRGAVVSDNEQGMRDLVRYVCEKGHRRIAYVHGEDTLVTRNRIASFYRTCEEFGIQVLPEYLKAAQYHDPESSAQATRELLELRKRPTCIMYPDDFSYIGGMNELERQGLSVPDDMSVAGYDGIYLADVLHPRLTTLEQDTEGIGTQVVRMLIKAIEKPKSFIPRHVVLPGVVRPGESVKSIIPQL